MTASDPIEISFTDHKNYKPLNQIEIALSAQSFASHDKPQHSEFRLNLPVSMIPSLPCVIHSFDDRSVGIFQLGVLAD